MNTYRLESLFILLLFVLNSCTDKHISHAEIDSYYYTDLDTSLTKVDFLNEIYNSEDYNIFKYRNFYNGGGVGIGDFNNDGLADLYFTSNMGSNKLYINKGDWKFEDITYSAGVGADDKWSTGVSLVDINQDGWLDIYVCNAGFRKNTNQKNTLYINQGNLTFKEEAQDYGLDEAGYTTHAAFFDYDKDGDLDVYLLNNSFIPTNTLDYSNKRELSSDDWDVPEILKGGGDKLLRNEGDRFKDVTKESGIYSSLIGFGLGVNVGDLNNDNWPDLYISNDFFEHDYMYINNQDGTFSEEIKKRVGHLSHSSMGADIADINSDGFPEIFVTDMLPDNDQRLKTTTTFDNINLQNLKREKGFYNQYMQNTLQLNNGDGHFKDIAYFSGVARSDWSWGALIFDVDNDGSNDLFVSNGIYQDVTNQDFIDFFADEVIQKMVLTGEKEKFDSIISRMPSYPLYNKLYINRGSLKFEDSNLSGFKSPTFSNGAAYGDLDNDGDLDLVVNNVNQLSQLFRNNSENNSISIELTYQKPNLNATGAKIWAFAEDSLSYYYVNPYRGFQSTVDQKFIFGLADKKTMDSLIILWPDETFSRFYNIAVDSLLQIDYQQVEKHRGFQYENLRKRNLKYNSTTPFAAHLEDDYNDFYYERNIPMQLSKEGPCIAVGDINGDDLMDIFIGGAADNSGKLYLATSSGEYEQSQAYYFEKFKAFEDTEAIFFDCDGDGDNDLLVGSGGNNVTYHKNALRDRLYINNDGVFELDLNKIPPVFSNTSVFRPYDVDSDGDLDLFVGVRSLVGEYGISPGSYIYINKGNGQFIDQTELVAPDLKYAGMVTDAMWVDLLEGRGKELVIVGEWMSPQILQFNGTNYVPVSTDLQNYSGWWRSVASTDIDRDGRQDLILGNIGSNFYLTATDSLPLLLWLNDFDQNGSVDKIITHRVDGKDKPIIVKRDLLDQLPGLKKELIKHEEYATKSIFELFSDTLVNTSVIKKINTLHSSIAYNQSNGVFRIESLPEETQLSSINVIRTYDIDGDESDEILLAGNQLHLLPQLGQLDGMGLIVVDYSEARDWEVSDILPIGQTSMVNDLELWKDQMGARILVGINDGLPILYRF